ncbi:DUF3618 domain-containing protein [Phytoactinopolyspora halotolerans]|uniref:DUF3618 domain-containing protein n=1 Tax=Phytoactinopolyspora halotolerans TaxID=1981512 RepID=A0A6L9SCL1_9ACTN|nr:DUF3618 domain-containing protein [Phytoactinopolyspora halotolerans]NEE02807.1 DUF3618 domain-containing protein [Phytoactinopolyspora halotolerans]
MSTPDAVRTGPREPVTAPSETPEEPERRPKRSAREIEQAINERSERLARNIDELVGRMSPGRLARDSAGRIGSKMTTPEGGPRVEVLGAIAGAVLVGGLLVWRSRRRRRR